MELSQKIEEAMQAALEDIRAQAAERMCLASETLETAAKEALSGARSGLWYRSGRHSHRASAPGEPPAQNTGAYAASWQAMPVEAAESEGRVVFRVRICTSMPERARALEYGAGNVKARPHMARIWERGRRDILKLLEGGAR